MAGSRAKSLDPRQARDCFPPTREAVPGCTAQKSECGDAGACDVDAGQCRGCASDDDCSDPQLPVCDPPSGRCGACSTVNDGCPVGRYCRLDGGTTTCADGCKKVDDCASIGGTPACCDHVCRDLASTQDHCGACGTACVGGDTCCAGACSATSTDPDNCGGCGAACSRVNNTPSCTLAKCVVACSAGFGDCDGMAQNGCETDTGQSSDHCGVCGNP